MLRFITPASTPETQTAALYTECCPAGFPSPAIFPSRPGCQPQRPERMLSILRWLETRRHRNQPLATLTIISALKALNSNGIVISIDGRARSPDCSFVPFVA